jgi:hypothetical protein
MQYYTTLKAINDKTDLVEKTNMKKQSFVLTLMRKYLKAQKTIILY